MKNEQLEIFLKAAREGNVTLMECILRDTGEPVNVLCTVETDADGATTMTPIAGLFSGNPFDLLAPSEVK